MKAARQRRRGKTRTAQGPLTAADKALLILSAFRVGKTSLSLAQLTEITGLNKATVLRLLRSLVRAQIVVRPSGSEYRIGPEALRLGTLYLETFNVADVLRPVMQRLADITKESVVFYIRDGAGRVCLLRVESEQPIRYHVREGEIMPLVVGSSGRVLLAFAGEPGEPYETIRREYFYLSLGERTPDTASIAAPVFGVNGGLVGALGISGPSTRVDAAFAQRVAPVLLDEARNATHDIGGDSSVFDAPVAMVHARSVKVGPDK